MNYFLLKHIKNLLNILRYDAKYKVIFIGERNCGKTYAIKMLSLIAKENAMFMKKLLKKPVKFYRRNRLKCNQFCNGHCAYECPNIEVQRFEDYYDLPAEEAGLHEITCRQCRFYDRYMTCNDCYFQFDTLCKYRSNFEKERMNYNAEIPV